MVASGSAATTGVGEHPPAFADVAQTTTRLEATGYLTDPGIATVVFLAQQLGKPILVEGPAGVGKTELAKAVAQARGAQLLRLQCYEGLDESKALYEWNYTKQLLRIQHASGVAAAGGERSMADWDQVQEDLFAEEYLLERPLLQALRAPVDTVLLIDEVDKVDVEFEALLLEVLAEFQVTIPELGTVRGVGRPTIILTSNSTRELSEALKRRCLYLHLEYPSLERERAIVAARVPEAPADLTDQVVRVVRSLRTLDLRKPPSISETLDWVRTLLALGHDTLDASALGLTANVLLKHQRDIELARTHLASVPARGGDAPWR
jgi:MoxR-like ATPase